MSKHRWQCLFALVAFVLSTSNTAMAKRPYPFLKSVDKVKFSVSVSADVKRQLRMMGAGGGGAIEGELKHLAATKLQNAGISPSGSSDAPELEVTAFTDFATDEFTITLSFSDTVSLVRESGTTFPITLWTRTGHPAADQTKDMQDALSLLVDEFIADRYESNPKK